MTAPLYLYTGPEFGERNDAVAAIKTAMKKKFGEIDEFLYYASETDFSEVVTTLQSESLFVTAKCVVLRGAELLKNKIDVNRLASWASSAGSDTTVLILVSDDISVDAKVEKLVPKSNRRIFWEMFENQKPEWLKKFFKNAGYSLQNEAADAILDLIENNTEALRTECSRFFLCFPAGHEITADDVENILSHNREESAFTLFDAMSDTAKSPSERLENSLAVLQKIRLSKNSSSVMIIAGLVSCFRRLSLWQSLHAGNAVLDDFALKTKGFSSKKARTQYANASRIWSAGQTAAIIALLAATDMAVRSGGTQLEETQLQMMLYAIIIKGGAFCAVYETEN